MKDSFGIIEMVHESFGIAINSGAVVIFAFGIVLRGVLCNCGLLSIVEIGSNEKLSDGMDGSCL